MSLRQRLRRLVAAGRLGPVDGRRVFGLMGERAAQAAIARACPDAFPNRLLPHPKRAGWTLEADLLVYAGDTVFAIELKAYRGALGLAEDGKTLLRAGPRGFEELGDPLNQARFFLEQLPRAVPALRGVKRVPLVAFRDDPGLDLGAVHDPAAGYLWASEVAGEIRRRLAAGAGPGDPQSPAAPGPQAQGLPPLGWWARLWARLRGIPLTEAAPAEAGLGGRDPAIAQALAALPTWDVVTTVDRAEHRGTLAGPGLALRDGWGREVVVPWGAIARVEVAAGSRLGHDRVTVVDRDGATTAYRSFVGEVGLDAPGGALGWWLREVLAIVPGGLAR